jgi:YfiH family protein
VGPPEGGPFAHLGHVLNQPHFNRIATIMAMSHAAQEPSVAIPPTNSSPANMPMPIQVPEWAKFGWLWHGFSTRADGVSQVYRAASEAGAGGDLNLGFTDLEDREAVRENRRRFVAALTGNVDAPLGLVRQVHSNVSLPIAATDGCLVQPGTVEADGLMSDLPGQLIGVLTADCIPVLVADPEHRAVAAFHAGWRGTVERIVELGMARMREAFGTDPQQAVAAIGPGIGACCYTVGNEVRQRFGERFAYADALFTAADAGQEMRLDLTEANRRQLLDAGLKAEAIAVVGGCTSCQPERFFSHRASGGRTGRMMAAIGVRGE